MSNLPSKHSKKKEKKNKLIYPDFFFLKKGPKKK